MTMITGPERAICQQTLRSVISSTTTQLLLTVNTTIKSNHHDVRLILRLTEPATKRCAAVAYLSRAAYPLRSI